MARSKEERLTYDHRRLAQDYVRGLPRVVREHTTVEPGRGSLREEKSCEGDENDKNWRRAGKDAWAVGAGGVIRAREEG